MFDPGVTMFDPMFFECELELVISRFPVGGEFQAVIGQDVSYGHAVASVQDVTHEVHRRSGSLTGVQLSPGEAGGGVATGQLVYPADPFQASDVEGVNADQLTGIIGLDMA